VKFLRLMKKKKKKTVKKKKKGTRRKFVVVFERMSQNVSFFDNVDVARRWL
jgi:hypothetical protein